VYQYRVGQDGSLTALSVDSIAAGPDPQSIASDPSGRYVYVVNGNATISQYAVGSGGELVALSPAIVNITVPASDPVAYAATIDPAGHFLYVVVTPQVTLPLPSAYIAEYAISTGGQLTPLAPGYINSPVLAESAVAIDSSGKHAYLAGVAPGLPGPGGVVAQFSIAVDGLLAPLAPATIETPADGRGIALSGTNAHLLSACVDTACDGQVAQYTVQSDGSLAPTEAATLLGGHVVPVALVTNTSGSAAYLLTNLMGVDTNEGAVYQYTIDSMGGLEPGSSPSLGVASGSVAEGTLGPNLHVLSSNSVGFASGAPTGGHVDHYVIGDNGLLTFLSTTSVAAGSYPTAMTLVAAQ
jgi:6-phosphogluconolactonase (cycloisomerase 2 family)